jgi:hypothetical protein
MVPSPGIVVSGNRKTQVIRCSGAPDFTQTVNVNGNGTYFTTNTTFKASSEGTWRWQVTYSGGANNQGSTSACGVERFTIANSWPPFQKGAGQWAGPLSVASGPERSATN